MQPDTVNIMRKALIIPAIALLAAAACTEVESIPAPSGAGNTKVDFDISVTREGEAIPEERHAPRTKGGADDTGYNSTMNTSLGFGLVGIDYDHHAIVVDNQRIGSSGDQYSTYFDKLYWDEQGSDKVSFSAYYPFVPELSYGQDLESYAIPFKAQDTDAGPLVSKTVEMAVKKLNLIPFEFQHITNDIGYCICDVTPSEELQGLIHLRKVTAYNVASAGVFVNDMSLSQGMWMKQGYYRNVVVFEGDAKVVVGSENEKFVGYETLVDHLADSHRYYSIPDEIEIGKQFVEVVYDVEGFTHNNFYYEPLYEQVSRYMLYGLLPNNVFVYGRQYTFHLGIDLSTVYQAITFAPSVGDWETKIYEDNESF